MSSCPIAIVESKEREGVEARPIRPPTFAGLNDKLRLQQFALRFGQRFLGAPATRTHELPGGRQVAVVAAVVLHAEVDEEFYAVRRQAEIRCAREDGVGESQEAPALTFVAAFLLRELETAFG